jgi:hypothetical protein
MAGFAGVTAIDTRARRFTFSVAEAVGIVGTEAVIEAKPPAKALANPFAVMLTTELAVELQFASCVRFCWLPSE